MRKPQFLQKLKKHNAFYRLILVFSKMFLKTYFELMEKKFIFKMSLNRPPLRKIENKRKKKKEKFLKKGQENAYESSI